MKTQITMDSAGRVLIPKALREEMRLRPGDVLELESQGDQVALRPHRQAATMTREHGIPVFHGGPCDVDLNEFIRQQREERNRFVAGTGEE